MANDVEEYIRHAALARGINPDVAVAVSRNESRLGQDYTGDQGSSFGPYQLHYGRVAPGGNAVGGLGDTFTKKTGLNARDPKTWRDQVDFSLDQARAGGWGPWHGWKGSPGAGIGTGNKMADDFLTDFDIAPVKENGGEAKGEKKVTTKAVTPTEGAPDFESDFEVAPSKVKAEPLHSSPNPPEPKPGILANADHDDVWGPLKNIATGAIKGIGNAAGFVGNAANTADYLMARAESAYTGKPVDQVLADFAAKREAKAANPSVLSKIENAIRPENVSPAGPDVYNPILKLTGEYVPQTEGQRLVQSGANAVFGSLGPGVRGAPNPVAGLVPNIVRQAPMLGATGALGQGVTDATGDPLLGAAATAAIPAATRLGGATLNRIVGTVDPNTAQLAQTARNQFGIPVGAGEISSNPMVRFANSVVNKLPGSGGTAHREEMQTGFNRAVSNTFGEDAPSITPQVMANARDRIGNVFESVAQRTPVIHADPQLATELRQTIHNAQATMTAGEVEPLIRQVQNIAHLVDPQTNTITGEIYQNLTKRGAPLDRAMQSQNPNIKNSAREIREALDGAMERSAPAGVRDDLRQARQDWRNLRTVEPLVAKAPTGDISPALLQGRVNSSFKGTHGAAYGGGGDLKTLSDIGQRFLKEPPSSGTSERGLIMHLIGGAASGAAGLAAGLPAKEAALAILAPALGAGAGRGIGGALRSNLLTERLINGSLGNPTRTAFGNYLYNSTLPALTAGNQLRP